MKLSRIALMAGLIVVPALMIAGCGDSVAKRSSVDNNVKNAKSILADLKTTFSEGKAVAETKGAEVGDDSRMGMLAILVADKIPYMVNKRITDESKKKPLQAKLKEVSDFIDNTLVPKFNEAKASKKPEQAKALVPLMDQLDKKLDEVNNLLP